MEGRFSAAQWGTLISAGVAQGSIYSLIALGYTLVYGILRLINFAHGDVFMFGGVLYGVPGHMDVSAGHSGTRPRDHGPELDSVRGPDFDVDRRAG